MTKTNRDLYLIHFTLYLFGSVALLWVIYLPINGLRFDWAHPSEHYQLASFLVLASAIFELLTRSTDRLLISSLQNRQINEISNRQILFALVFIFGFMVIMQDASLSRLILALYVSSLAVWSLWMNRFGYRMLVQFYYSDRNKNFNLKINPRLIFPRKIATKK